MDAPSTEEMTLKPAQKSFFFGEGTLAAAKQVACGSTATIGVVEALFVAAVLALAAFFV